MHLLTSAIATKDTEREFYRDDKLTAVLFCKYRRQAKYLCSLKSKATASSYITDLQIIVITDVRVSVLHHCKSSSVVTLLVSAGATGEGPPLQTQLLLAWEGSSLEILLPFARVITHDQSKEPYH